MYKLYLASRSARRQALLAKLGIEFTAMPVDIDEEILNGEKPLAYVKRMALWKALVALGQIDRNSSLVIGADTIVSLGDSIFGKPQDFSDFHTMMTHLSGQTHEVHTCVYVVSANRRDFAVSTSKVTFAPLTDEMILNYWRTQEPLDKAGGYAIQGIAATFISHMEGSFTGVVGLPLFELTQLLETFEIQRPTLLAPADDLLL